MQNCQLHLRKRAQQVRTPNEVLAMNQGNCIEMAVLYSSLCEAFELHPIIIIMRGHASLVFG